MVRVHSFCTMRFDWLDSQRQHISDSNEFNLTFANNIFGQQLPTLLDVTCCVCCMLHKLWNCSNFSVNNSHHFSFVPWSPTHSTMLNVGSVCTALPTLLGPCTHIAGSWCICLHTTANTEATTSNIFDATIMLGVVCQLIRSLSPVA